MYKDCINMHADRKKTGFIRVFLHESVKRIIKNSKFVVFDDISEK